MDKNNFESLSENKIDFIKRFALDNELAKLMINSKPNYKDNVVTEAQKYSLMNTQIYPRQKVMENIIETKSYITMKFKYRATKGANVFKAAYITFFIFCHEDIVLTSYMSMRYDKMLECVNRLINDTRGEGWIGKLAFDTMDEVSMDSTGKYLGLAVTYKNTEFQ
jgi:hypothetical protein